MVAWTLVFHIIGLVFWLGSLLVVTQVLAIHTEETSPETRATLGRLESKLLKGLAHPGAALMVITGTILLSLDPNYLREHWLHAKLLLVIILVALDLRVTFRVREFQEGKIELSRRECMALHGAISLVFFGILILVLVKPFGLHRRQAQLEVTGDPITKACLRHAGDWPVAILPASEAALEKQEGL
jgi:putative membrane protein